MRQAWILVAMIILSGTSTYSVCPDPWTENMVFCEDNEATAYDEHFLERSRGTNYEGYWTEFLAKAVRDTAVVHTGNASLRWNCPVDMNMHGAMGFGPADYGNGWDLDLDVHEKRYWLFRWYQRWEASDNYSSSGKLYYLGCGGDYYYVTKGTSTSFLYVIRDEYGGDLIDHGWVSHPTSLDDEQWHRMEIFIDFGTAGDSDGDSWMKIDDTVLYNTTGLAFVSHPTPVDCLSLPGNHGAGGDSYGSQYSWIEDIEIYAADSAEDLFTPDCSEGAINESCYCNRTLKDSGYCCNDVWNQDACLLIDYGFEDWTGDADTSPGYVFSTNYESYWDIHQAGTEGIAECEGRTAYDGEYFWRKQFSNGYADPCLGTTTTSENSHNTLGYAGTYPLGSGDDVSLSTDALQDNLTYRMRVRFPDPLYDHYPGMKFFTQSGNSGDEEAFVLFADTDHPDVYYRIFGYPCSYVGSGTIPGLRDGEWHDIVINFEITAPSVVNTRMWVDDWDMQYSPLADAECDLEGQFGTGFGHSVIVMNYGGNNPNDPMAVEVDDLQVWDGVPDFSEDIAYHPADNDHDGIVSTREIRAYVGAWKQGAAGMDSLFQVLVSWKTGESYI